MHVAQELVVAADVSEANESQFSTQRVAIALVSTSASGTERRLGRLFRLLSANQPDRYHLITSREVFEQLRLGGFGLEDLPNVHVLGGRSPLDSKRAAEEGWLANFGRAHTLIRYRKEIRSLLRRHGIGTLQLTLEMVPFLGMFPIRDANTIVSLVSHLPKYYDGRSLNSRLLINGMRRADKVDALYDYITQRVLELGIDPMKINSPRATCVDHDRFRPEQKEQVVTFVARAMLWKNPQLMVRVIQRVFEQSPGTKFHVMGDGPLLRNLVDEVEDLGLDQDVFIGHHDRPYEIVNRSLVHACLEEYDNAPNQSTLEGMAAGCALVATDVGLTAQTVTPEVGVLVRPDEAEIADQVSKKLADPEVAQELGASGRAKVLREFNTADYLEYLQKLHDFSTPGPIVRGKRVHAADTSPPESI